MKKVGRPKGSKNKEPFGEEWRLKHGDWGKGIPKSEETRRKMSEASKGKPKSEEHKVSMRETQRRRWAEHKRLSEERPELTAKEIWNLIRELTESVR